MKIGRWTLCWHTIRSWTAADQIPGLSWHSPYVYHDVDHYHGVLHAVRFGYWMVSAWRRA